MPRKPSKRKSGRKSRKPSASSTQWTKIFGAITILMVLVAAAGWITDRMLRRPVPAAAVKTPRVAKLPAATESAAATKPPRYEIYPREKPAAVPPAAPLTPSVRQKELPRVALIIDDVGYNRKVARRLLDLDAPVTLSIFPFSPHGRAIARKAAARGVEVLLHLPMEPLEYPRVNPGPGVLLSSMSTEELIDQLDRDLDDLPGVIGVNNHMGSRMTADRGRMNQILAHIHGRNLFFIDSRTTHHSVGRDAARALHIPFAERQVFLDHTREAATIRSEIQRLIAVAQRQGSAVGIGHPYTITVEVLEDELARIKKHVRLVPASQVVGQIG